MPASEHGYSVNAPHGGMLRPFVPPGGVVLNRAHAAPGGAGAWRLGAAQAELEHKVQALLAFESAGGGRPNKELKRMARQAAAPCWASGRKTRP